MDGIELLDARRLRKAIGQVVPSLLTAVQESQKLSKPHHPIVGAWCAGQSAWAAWVPFGDLDTMEIVMFIEEAFSVHIDDDDLDEMKTVKDISLHNMS
jgi:hypothetical protein